MRHMGEETKAVNEKKNGFVVEPSVIPIRLSHCWSLLSIHVVVIWTIQENICDVKLEHTQRKLLKILG